MREIIQKAKKLHKYINNTEIGYENDLKEGDHLTSDTEIFNVMLELEEELEFRGLWNNEHGLLWQLLKSARDIADENGNDKLSRILESALDEMNKKYYPEVYSNEDIIPDKE